MKLGLYIKKPYLIPLSLQRIGYGRFIPDGIYLKCLYKQRMGCRLNLRRPSAYTEKIQWLKLHDRNPEYVKMVDKFAVKEIVSNSIGQDYVIPAYGVWDKFEDIDFSTLPNQFVLKCTHDSGGIIVCENKDKLNISEAKKILENAQRTDYYLQGREWPYKYVKPRILAEQYMVDSKTNELRDYKFFTFDGKVKMMFIAADRQSEEKPTTFDFYDENGAHLNIINGHPNALVPPELPMNFDKMKELAEILAQNIPQVRIDFYEIDGRIYFGEYTFFHHSGFTPFEPNDWDEIMGRWITAV